MRLTILQRTIMMATLLCMSVSAQQAKSVTVRQGFSQTQIGTMTTAMMDGDLCRRIVLPAALHSLTHEDPRDKWASADNYDVDAAVFLQVKKTMLRLQTLSHGETAFTLWLEIPQNPGLSQVVIRLPPALSAFYNGEMTQPTPAQIQEVLKSGKQMEFSQREGLHIVLAPVRDSLGHVAAVVEIATQRFRSAGTNQHNDY